MKAETARLHPAWTYMLHDCGGGLWGMLVFATALLAPGYCFGQALDLCGFRAGAFLKQLAWSVALSFGLGTLPLVAAVWIAGIWGGVAFLLGASILAIGLFSRERHRSALPWKGLLPFALVAAGWAVLVACSLVDVGRGQHLWMSVTTYDHSLRTAFVEAVLRSGVPPVNPAYWPDHDAPMRYYYFWYVVCAAVAKLAHISARQAFIASCAWPFFGVAAMLALFGRYLLGWTGNTQRRRWWTALVLTSVTGLDVLVVLFVWLGGDFVAGDLEWWSIDQVTSWLDTFLWVPHHAAALVCCLLGILLLWLASNEPRLRERMVLATVAGVSFASAFGLSVYVTAASAFVLSLWLGWRLFHDDRKRAATAMVLAGLVALLVLAPYLVQLLRPQPNAMVTPGHVLVPGIRKILQPDVLYGLPGLQSLRPNHPKLAEALAALTLLAPCYCVELGFFAAVLFFGQRKRRFEAGETTLLFYVWAGLASASFVRSGVIATNDYGIRATLLPQFMLLLLGVLVLERASGWTRRALLGLAVIGIAGTVYQVFVLRLYLPVKQKHHTLAINDLAEREYALRDAYAELRTKIRPNARVQYSVRDSGYFGYFGYVQLINVGHQVTVDADKCNASFGGDLAPCAHLQSAIAKLYPADGQPVSDRHEASIACNEMGAQYLVATSWDPVWKQSESWVWSWPIIVDRPSVRVLRCPMPPHQ